MTDKELLIGNNLIGLFLQERQATRKTKNDTLAEMIQMRQGLSERFVSLYTCVTNETYAIRQAFNKAFMNAWQKNIGFMQSLFEWMENDRKTHKEDGHNFNVFTMLTMCGMGIGETNHSRILKFLLESNELHGQGKLFLYLFLKKLGIEVSDNVEEEHWNVFAEQGHIDILLVRNHPLSVIIIENKSNWAADQANQLYRYWYYAIYSRTRKTALSFYEDNRRLFRIVYLTPNEYKTPSHQTLERPHGWSEDLPSQIPMKVDVRTFNHFICQWLDDCKQALPTRNHALREYLRQYEMTCKNL